MDNDIITDVTKCTEVLEPFSQGMGVYLTPEEVEYIKGVILEQRRYIEALEIHVDLLHKDNQNHVTGIGQC